MPHKNQDNKNQDMESIAHSVAFSGYRTSKILKSNGASTDGSNCDPTIIKQIEQRLLRSINSLYSDGARNFFSGGSTGFDTLAAEAVLKFKTTHPDITLTLALPFAHHDSNFSPQQRARLQATLDSADKVIYVSQGFHDRAYIERNNYMLRNSSTLVCYFDGQRGGTMYTINRALKYGHKIINLCEGYPIIDSAPQLRLF